MSAAPKLAVLPASQPNVRIEPGDILKLEQLAERLQVPPSWVYKQVAKKGPHGIPVLRCGRHLRFVWPEVCAWMRNGKDWGSA